MRQGCEAVCDSHPILDVVSQASYCQAQVLIPIPRTWSENVILRANCYGLPWLSITFYDLSMIYPLSLTGARIYSHWTPRLDQIDFTSSHSFSCINFMPEFSFLFSLQKISCKIWKATFKTFIYANLLTDWLFKKFRQIIIWNSLCISPRTW